MKRAVGWAVVCAMLVSGPGCAVFRPAPTMATCRDSAGRYASCGTGPSAEGVLGALGIAALLTAAITAPLAYHLGWRARDREHDRDVAGLETTISLLLIERRAKGEAP